MQTENEFIEFESKRKEEYEKMHKQLSKFDDYEKYKHILPPFIEKTYEDYKTEYKILNTEKNDENDKSQEAGESECKNE